MGLPLKRMSGINMTEIYFTLNAKYGWVQTTKDQVHYRVCTVTDEQLERVRSDETLCLQPSGAKVRVVKASVVTPCPPA